MKTSIKHQYLLPVLVAGLGLLLADRASGQNFTTLHNFDYYDGANPYAGVILSGSVLYGTTKHGNNSAGAVFSINSDGTGFTNLHGFLGFPYEGGSPTASLVLSSNVLYGTSGEGISGDGTVFKVNTDGSDFTTLHAFSALSDGSSPIAGLILSSNVLYGTTVGGGSNFNGTAFRVNIDGTGFTNLHNFSELLPTNSGCANPYGGLVLLGSRLYGTAFNGGTGDGGTVFALNTDGSDFRSLYTFTALTGSYPFYTNSDGANPRASLILSGNTLYGTAQNRGSGGVGTVFALNTDGTGFTNLHSFTAPIGSGPYYTNEDGIFPEAGLVASGNWLYGTTWGGGSSGVGTVFAVNKAGTDFIVLRSFNGSDGANPAAGLIVSDNTLYGTTAYGGGAYGTVFSISFKPRLTITPYGVDVVLMWPTNYAGFDYRGYTLQSTTNLGLSGVWHPVAPVPVIINGQKVVTNPVSGTQQFYRLVQ